MIDMARPVSIEALVMLAIALALAGCLNPCSLAAASANDDMRTDFSVLAIDDDGADVSRDSETLLGRVSTVDVDTGTLEPPRRLRGDAQDGTLEEADAPDPHNRRERNLPSEVGSGPERRWQADDGERSDDIFSHRSKVNATADPSDAHALSQHLSARIVGGYVPDRSLWPFIVSLHTVYPGRNRDGRMVERFHDCGGILIAPDCVLTSAHCTLDYYGVPINGVQVGRYDEPPGQLRSDGRNHVVQWAANHPRWDMIGRSKDSKFDVRIIRLYGRHGRDEPAALNRNAAVPTDGGAVFAAGWGVTTPGGEDSSDILLETSLSYVNNAECSLAEGVVMGNYRKYGSRRIGSDMLCTFRERTDSCEGDSGGPVVERPPGGGAVSLVGVISWGFSCAHPDFPGVSSRVSALADWMDMALCAMSDEPPAESECGPPWRDGAYGGPVEVRVELQLNDRPDETGWLIQAIDDGTIFRYVPLGSYRDRPNEVVTETVTIRRNKRCRFVMFDDPGNGGVKYKLTKAVGGLLAQGSRAAFGRSVEHRFHIGSTKEYDVVPWFLGMDYSAPIRITVGGALLFKFKPGTATVHEFSSREAYDACNFSGGNSRRIREVSPGRVVVVIANSGDDAAMGDTRYFSSSRSCARGQKLKVQIVAGDIGRELVRHGSSWCDRVHNHIGDPLRPVSESACRNACLGEIWCLGYQYQATPRRCHILPYRPAPISAVQDTTKKMAERMRDYVCSVAV